MNLNENNMSKYVIGKEYSYPTLKSMSKDALIELLNIAQHNYEVANERLFNVTQYAEKLDNALDKVITEVCGPCMLDMDEADTNDDYIKQWRAYLFADDKTSS